VAARADALDLDDPDAVDAYARAGARDWPRLDILVHNASSYAPSPPDGPTAPDALGHYRVNALSPLLLSTALAPLLRASALPGGGAIVAMCDIHALGRPRPGFVAYEMSKAALGAMVSALARELAPRVRVNAVAPGVVAFPDSGADSDPAMQARYLSRVPLARAGTPEDAAEAVRWLALDARYTTGQIIRVDGGRWVT
ncbi:MAG TPA: pteridine reductase, partial [Phycisphaerales bacterium]|nr:pteridine reductase [Phycisphaerales bacterium]